LVVNAGRTGLSVNSPARVISAVEVQGGDLTTPGMVTGLTVSDMTNKATALSWTDPPDTDLTGAVVRSALGATAPTRVTDGPLSPICPPPTAPSATPA
jgi:hypothetical protein